MALNMPIFKIVGERPIKMVKTSDGGAEILSWDWDAKDFGVGGPEDFDVLMEFESPGGGVDALDPSTPLLGGADVRTVTEGEFNAHVEQLKKPLEPTLESLQVERPHRIISISVTRRCRDVRGAIRGH